MYLVPVRGSPGVFSLLGRSGSTGVYRCLDAETLVFIVDLTARC